MTVTSFKVELTAFEQEVLDVIVEEGPIIYVKKFDMLASVFGYDNSQVDRLCRALRHLMNRGLIIRQDETYPTRKVTYIARTESD